MLFGYPIEATSENWLHDCLIEMIEATHESIKTGSAIPSWPDIIPDIYRSSLRRRTSLKKHLENYQIAARKLSASELSKVSIAVINQNNISDLLAGVCDCDKLEDFPETIKEPAKALFEFGFKLLSDLKVRDQQYKTIFDKVPYHICPFCGCEYFDAPGAPREALDHYLAESKYPFAATNLHNLVPMGNKCNSKYKLATDILHNEDGERRKSFNPYGEFESVTISLENSTPFARVIGFIPLPEWQIDFKPNVEEVATWSSVFQIEERYKRDNLDSEFVSWLREFQYYCKSSKFKPINEQDVLRALDAYLIYLKESGVENRAFLKFAVFEMLISYYQNGDDRVKLFINSIAIGGIA